MLIQCRPSAYQKFEVSWESFEMVKMIRHNVKAKVIKKKEFDSYADANGFVTGMMLRGIRIISFISI